MAQATSWAGHILNAPPKTWCSLQRLQSWVIRSLQGDYCYSSILPQMFASRSFLLMTALPFMNCTRSPKSPLPPPMPFCAPRPRSPAHFQEYKALPDGAAELRGPQSPLDLQAIHHCRSGPTPPSPGLRFHCDSRLGKCTRRWDAAASSCSKLLPPALKQTSLSSIPDLF